jgi:ABC-type multidrug transport system fused ATPase/permease subunit
LDPFSLYNDVRLWDALRRSCLVENELKLDENSGDKRASALISRFTLDSVVEPEGLNLSVGERSLLSLARALVKDSQIVVLDEAT